MKCMIKQIIQHKQVGSPKKKNLKKFQQLKYQEFVTYDAFKRDLRDKLTL